MIRTEQVWNLIRKGDCSISIDLKSDFYHQIVNAPRRPYLAMGKICQQRAMSFGISHFPDFFTQALTMLWFAIVQHVETGILIRGQGVKAAPSMITRECKSVETRHDALLKTVPVDTFLTRIVSITGEIDQQQKKLPPHQTDIDKVQKIKTIDQHVTLFIKLKEIIMSI
ncbi:MAG: hypothetical protein EZS28_026140 [Streblomastix strix]|uniref:Uncharacterized protein n=1 Tax=Streblomastix strix TaxID=222440 RepID=A0A5J4V7T3_9EUKA|nr:MAG: hypothetical protein EZS28_026140 [Streblomastix strix]